MIHILFEKFLKSNIYLSAGDNEGEKKWHCLNAFALKGKKEVYDYFASMKDFIHFPRLFIGLMSIINGYNPLTTDLIFACWVMFYAFVNVCCFFFQN